MQLESKGLGCTQSWGGLHHACCADLRAGLPVRTHRDGAKGCHKQQAVPAVHGTNDAIRHRAAARLNQGGQVPLADHTHGVAAE